MLLFVSARLKAFFLSPELRDAYKRARMQWRHHKTVTDAVRILPAPARNAIVFVELLLSVPRQGDLNIIRRSKNPRKICASVDAKAAGIHHLLLEVGWCPCSGTVGARVPRCDLVILQCVFMKVGKKGGERVMMGGKKKKIRACKLCANTGCGERCVVR